MQQDIRKFDHSNQSQQNKLRGVPRLAQLLPRYQPMRVEKSPDYVLQAEDLELAFSDCPLTESSHIRDGSYPFHVAPLERLFHSILTTGEHRAVNLAETFRSEAATFGLYQAGCSKEVMAIARFTRTIKLTRDGDGHALALMYGLESVSVLPAYKKRGYERLAAVGVAGIIGRDLEILGRNLWHTQALSIAPRFVSRLAKGLPINRIIAQRLNDDVIAQDNLLRLDGKLARFLPLTAA